MKKIFTLLALAAITATSALAGNGMKGRAAVSIDPSKIEASNARVLQKIQKYKATGELDGYMGTRFWEDPNGTTWKIVIMKEGLGFDLTSLKDDPKYANATEKEKLSLVPCYEVICNISAQNSTDNETTDINLSLMWPTRSIWNGDQTADLLSIVSVKEFATGANVINPQTGQVTNVPTSKVFTTHGNSLFYEDETTGWYLYGMFCRYLVDTGVVAKINNITFPYDSANKISASLTEGSVINFMSVDEEEEGRIYTINPKLTMEGTQGTTATLNINYFGQIRQALTPEAYRFNIGNATVWFNSNNFDNVTDIEEGMNYTGEWEPLSRYYFALCDALFTLRGVEDNKLMTSGPFDMNKLKVVRTSDEAISENHFNYVSGTFFAPNSAQPMDKIEGKYVVTKPNEIKDESGAILYRITPAAGMLIPSGYNTGWSTKPNADKKDGLNCVWNQYYFYPRNPSQIVFGTPDGIYLNLIDSNGNTYVGSYKGEIAYAKDNKDMCAFQAVPSVGTFETDGIENVNVEEPVMISAANGMINVIANENATVEVYALNGAKVAAVRAIAGQLTTINAAKGMYVVKVGNQAKKVVL